MTISQTIYGKAHAVVVLLEMVRWLENWQEVWQKYRSTLPLPPLQFRAGFTLHHDSNDDPVMLLQEVMIRGCYRKYVNLPLRGTMLDIGANIGSTTLDFSHRCPDLRIHAYEPNPQAAKMLRLNIETNHLTNRVLVHEKAVGRANGELFIWTNTPTVEASTHSDVPPSANAVRVRVPAVDLNQAVRDTGADEIAFLKIDAEGAESDMLEGATAETMKKVKQVALEYHDRLFPDSLARCRRVLDNAGFIHHVHPYVSYQGLLYAYRPA
jgi:FkbM family methyltransferase